MIRLIGFIFLWILVCAGSDLCGQKTPSLDLDSGPGVRSVDLLPYHCPLVADPKLDDGQIPVSFLLKPPGTVYHVGCWITRDKMLVRQVFNGPLTGSADPLTLFWDGKDGAGQFALPGLYKIHVRAEAAQVSRIVYPVHVVRLGIREIEAQPVDEEEVDEWQMVYYLKGGAYSFYATPAIHEYFNDARPGEVADLDLNDGSPRPPVPLHLDLDMPVMNDGEYDRECFNYPVCFLKGARPCFEATLGEVCADSQGTPLPCGYPLEGIALRLRAHGPLGEWESAPQSVSPGAALRLIGPALPDEATREDRTLTWTWQYRPNNQLRWNDIPGSLTTDHRFYTVVNAPFWNASGVGTQYSGPWVEVADDLYTFSQVLGMDTGDEAGVQAALLHGFFGQEGGLATAIEGIVYDTYTMGGDGGANHYFQSYLDNIQLSRLLNHHALGMFVNCSDVAASTSVMLGMLGVQNVRMVHLGKMTLRAIWGIGCPGYTLNLWGSSAHKFSYHHIITRDGGTTVSDACMWLDEDGDPDSLPGTPGYNCDRPWAGTQGYDALSSTNVVTKTLDVLPKLN